MIVDWLTFTASCCIGGFWFALGAWISVQLCEAVRSAWTGHRWHAFRRGG